MAFKLQVRAPEFRLWSHLRGCHLQQRLSSISWQSSVGSNMVFMQLVSTPNHIFILSVIKNSALYFVLCWEWHWLLPRANLSEYLRVGYNTKTWSWLYIYFPFITTFPKALVKQAHLLKISYHQNWVFIIRTAWALCLMWALGRGQVPPAEACFIRERPESTWRRWTREDIVLLHVCTVVL